MRRTFAALGTFAVVIGLLALTEVSSAAADSSGPGVTPTSIHIGITYPDVAAIANIVNLDPGNYQVAYTTVIDQINARGGINGRKVVPTFAAIDPLGTASAATVCTQLTEDDRVFAVVGWFQVPDTACYVTDHDTPIIGLSLSSAAAVQARAPWFNPGISDSDQIPKEMTTFEQEGVFAGKKVAVVGDTLDQAETSLVLTDLKRLKVDVVQTGINNAPSTDQTAVTSANSIIAQKFEASGASVVVAVGNEGEAWPASLQSTQSTYLPRLIAVDYSSLNAYVTNKSGYSQAVLKGALSAGGTPPPSVEWDDPAMKRCVATIHAAEPGAVINNPVTATASTPQTWTAPESACQEMALFTDIAKAAGKTLNNETFNKGGESLTHVTIPGGGGIFDFGQGHRDGDGPVFVFEWSPSASNLELKTTVG